MIVVLCLDLEAVRANERVDEIGGETEGDEGAECVFECHGGFLQSPSVDRA
jgi:hypothetical protein